MIDSKRNQTIDLAKGFAIILMVIGHCYSKENMVLRMIYAFHMPFFFLISGVIYSEKWKDGITFQLLRTCCKLLIPYFIFDSLFGFFVVILGRHEDAFGVFYDMFVHEILPLAGKTVTWYLPCQLMLLCIFVCVAKLLRNKLFCIVLFVSLYLIGMFSPITDLFFPLHRSLIGMGFFAFGYYANTFFSKKYGNIQLLCAALLFLILSELNGMVSLVALRFSNPILYTVNGLLGSWILIQVCIRVRSKRLAGRIGYLGSNTLIILCTHMFVVELIRLLDYKLFDNFLYRLGVCEGLIFGIAVLLVMFPVIYISNRHFRVLFGK